MLKKEDSETCYRMGKQMYLGRPEKSVWYIIFNTKIGTVLIGYNC